MDPADRLVAEKAEEDAWIDQFGSRLKYLVLRSCRALALAVIAMWLSANQPYASYSVVVIGVLVLVLGSLNRFSWLAGVMVLWLLALYLAPPEMVTVLKAMRG